MFVDHDNVIRRYWTRRSEPLIEDALRRAFAMRRSLRKHAENRVYAHPKMGDRA
jgi:hypothetical protein